MNKDYTEAEIKKIKFKETRSRPAEKPKKRLKITNINDVNDTWAIDIAYMNYDKGFNDGYRYIFVVIDAFSRKAFYRTIKDGELNADKTLLCLKEIIKETGKPKKIWADQDKLFYNEKWKNYLEKKNIVLYSTFSENKSIYVERLQRTLKFITEELLKTGSDVKNETKQEKVIRKNRWIDVIEKVFETYNGVKHGTTKEIPNELFSNKEKQKQRKEKLEKDFSIYSNEKVEPAKYELNDIVRVSIVKNKFDKGFMSNWSPKLYMIVGILPTNPITYKLIDAKDGEPIVGKFYESELKKSELPEPNNKIENPYNDQEYYKANQVEIMKSNIKKAFEEQNEKDKIRREKQGRPLTNIVEEKRVRKPNSKYFK